MPRITKYKPLYPWMGGLNTSVDPIILDHQDLVQADNIVFTNSGSRRKRGGQARYNSVAIGSSAASVLYITDYWATVSSAKRERFVAVANDNKVYRSDPAAGTWSSFSTLALSVSHGGITSTVMNEDLILGLRSNGVPKTWLNQSTSVNLTTLTASSGSIPFSSAWIVSSFLNRLFVAGDPANPDKLYVSSTGDQTNWTISSTPGKAITLDVGVGDGDPSGITAIFPGTAGDGVFYAAKRRSIYVIDCSAADQTTWSVRRLTNKIGVINPNAVTAVDEVDIFFLSDRGMHTLSQVISGTAVKEGSFISAPIQEDYRSIINAGDRDKISLVYVPSMNSLLFSCKRTGQTTFETIYGFNLEIQKWFRWTATPSNFLMMRFNKTDGVEELYGCGTDGYVNLMNDEDRNDFGAPIVTRIKSAFIAPEGIPLQDNQYTNLALIYRARENSTFRVYYSVDGLTTKSLTYQQRIAGGNLLGTTLLGPAFLLGQIQALKPVWQHLGIDQGASVQFTFEQDGLDEDFELFGLVLEYEADEESQNAFTNGVYNS